MEFLLDFILHIDLYLINIIQTYHTWAYIILFFIIFCETGLVMTPFLPGDSLLFIAGAITALPDMPLEINLLTLILLMAAVLGDSCNYMIGRSFGKILCNRNHSIFLNRSTWIRPTSFIENTEEKLSSLPVLCLSFVHSHLCSRYGEDALPFLYDIQYNRWSLVDCLILLCRLFLRDMPVVQDNLKLLIVAIIVISILPAVFEILRMRFRIKTTSKA